MVKYSIKQPTGVSKYIKYFFELLFKRKEPTYVFGTCSFFLYVIIILMILGFRTQIGPV